MANEITLLESWDGGVNYDVLFLYSIATPVKINNVNVIPTPSAGLPPGVAAQTLTNTEKNALDGGTLAFEVVQFQRDPSATGAAMTQRIKDIYALRRAKYLNDYNAKYTFATSNTTVSAGFRITYP